MMEWWNNGIIAFHVLFVKAEGGKTGASHPPPQAYIGPKGAIPTFHFSNIPSFQSIVSAANLSSEFNRVDIFS
jgi:hypothetical protein